VPQFSSARQCLSAGSLSVSLHFFRGVFLLLLVAIITTTLPAVAQSEWQLYSGTSFLWAKTSPYAQQLNLSTLHEFGWQADISQYPWRWFGGTLEASGFYGRPNIYDPINNRTYSDLLNVKSYTIMFGPTFAYKRNPRFEPFGHVLLGGINRQYSLTSKAEIFTGYPLNYSKWIFGWALGGGADVSLNRLIAIRGQMDWIPSTFKNLYNDRENNLRVSFGLVFRFGNEEPARAGLKPAQPLPSTEPSLAATSSNSTGEGQQAVAQHTSPAVPSDKALNVLSPVASPATAPMKGAKVEPSAAPLTRVVYNQSHVVSEEGVTLAAQRIPDEANNLQPGGAQPSVYQTVSAIPASTPQATVEFWSEPTGADLEVDGEYVGSTFSTIAMPPGQHTIIIRKKDFATWQRTIRVTSGNIRVAAYMEQVRYTVHFDQH
jgi:hypothetical protein